MTAELELSNAGKQDSTPSFEAGEEVHSREIFPMCTSNPGVPGELWLPTYLKVRFAMVQLARGGIILLRSGYLRKLYADTFGVSLSLLAFFIAIATTIDLCVCMGLSVWSDQLRTRWGRRRPLLAVGLLPLGVVSVAIWIPPCKDGCAAGYLCVMLILWYLAQDICHVGYDAWAAELTPSIKDRTSLMGYKAFATIVGATIGLVFPGALSVSLGLHGACVAVAICCAIVLLVSGFIVVYTFKERPSISLTANSPFALSVMQALRNPPFRTVILCTILAQLGNDMAFGVMPFYTDYVLEAKEPGALFAFMAAMNLLTRLCLIPVYAKLMNWMGKKRTAILSAILCAASGPSLLLLNKDNCENYLVVALVCSFNGGSAAAWELLNPTLLADTIDYDELLSGQRREAMYMGLLTVLPAFIDIPAAVVPLNLMGNAGYVADKHPQNNAVVAVIIMCMVVIPACCMAIVAVVYTTYPIRDDAHQAQVKQAAAARSSYEEVIDPVTGAQLPALARDRQSDDRDYFYSREKTLAKKCGGTKGLEAILLMELGLVLAFAGMAVYIIADGVDGLGSGEETWAPVGIAMLVMASGIVYFNWSRLTVARNMRRDNKDSENVETKTLESGTQHEQVEHSMIAM